MTHHRLSKKNTEYSIKLGDKPLKSICDTGSKYYKTETEKLSKIIKRLNDLFSGELSENDLLTYTDRIKTKIQENTTVMAQLKTNAKEQAILGDFQDIFNEAIINSLEINENLASQVLAEDNVQHEFADILLDMIYEEILQ